MIREDVLLSFLSVIPAETFTITQIQKGLFLISKQASDMFDTNYNFEPKSYGPSSSELWDDLLLFEAMKFVRSVYKSKKSDIREFMATPFGIEQAKSFTRNERTSEYLQRVAEWVKKLSCPALISTILNEYPEMAVNTLFRS